MDNLFSALIISIVSASTFLFLGKFFSKLPKSFAFVKKFVANFIKYIVGLFKTQNVFSNRLNESFDQNMQILYSFLGSDNFKYKLPFILVMGAEKSGKSTLINSLHMEKSIDDLAEKNDFCNWSLFNDAVILEMHSSLFSSGLSGVSSDGDNWNKLLDLLSYHRSEKPIDSLVLTISMKDILDDDINITNLAEHYYIKLWKMHKAFGTSFPIYVVITHTDIIPGFSYFSSSLQSSLQDDMFGWSNPNSINQINSADFVNEAMNHIIDRLLKIQQKILVNNEAYVNSNGIFMFPFELYKITDKLKNILGYIFKKNSYHDNFMLRGFYFTGSCNNNTYVNHEFSQSLKSVEFGEITHNLDLKISDNICFVNNLFINKILKERGLSKALSSNILDNSKKVKFLQCSSIACIVLGTGSLIYYYSNIQKINVGLKNNIANVRLSLNNVKLIYGGKHDEFDSIIFEEQAILLINAMSKIRVEDLYFYSMPPSWFSSLRYKLNFMLGNAYSVVIFKFMVNKFNHDLKMLVNRSVMPKNKSKNDFNPIHSKEFINLFSYIKEVVRLENVYNKMQRIPYLRNLDDVIYIMKNLLDIDMRKSFYNNRSVFQNAVKHVELGAVSLDKYKQNIINNTQELFDKFLNKSFEYHRVMPYIDEIELLLNKMEKKEDSNISKLHIDLNKFVGIVNNQGFKWISTNKFNLGKSFNSLLYKVQDSYILGRPIAKNMKSSIEMKLINLKDKIIMHRVPLIGTMLKQGNNGTIQISKDFEEFQGMLNSLSGQMFMRNRDQQISTTLKTNLVKWNVSILEEISKSIDEFKHFSNHKVLHKSEKITQSMNIVACNSIVQNIRKMLAESQKLFDEFDSEEMFISNASNNLINSYKHLLKILVFVKNKNSALFDDIREMLYKQSIILLERVDALLLKKNLYNVYHANFYSENRDSMNKNDVKSYLVKQKEQLDFIANLAQPAVFLLEKISHISKKIYVPIFLKWQDIITNINNDKEGKANNIKSLENFVENYFIGKKDEECINMEIHLDNDHVNYFSQKKNNLVYSMKNKCVLDQYIKAKSKYKKIASFFNQHMIHKFPFNKVSNSEIEIGIIKEFLNLWKEGNYDIDMLDEYIKDPKQRPWIDFLKKMKSTVSWLKCISECTEKNKGALLITLRTNRDNEYMGNYLSEWSMKFNNKVISMNMNAQEIPFMQYDFQNIFRISKESDLSFIGGESYTKSYKGFFGFMRFANQYKSHFCGKTKRFKIDIPIKDCKNNNKLTVWMDIELKGNLNEWPDFPGYAPALPKGDLKLCIK